MHCHKNELSVVYWNANGIDTKIHELYTFLQDNFVDIACETFLKSNSNLHSHPEFKVYRIDREDTRRKGGVMIIIRKNIVHQLIPHSNCKIIENIGIDINTANRKIHFISCYLPGGTSNEQIRIHLKNDLRLITADQGRNRNCKFYALGDFNCKHRYWGCQRANTGGSILYNEFNVNNFNIIYPFDHTYYPTDVRRQSSTLDIGLTNCALPHTDLETHCLGSDHNAILFKIYLNENMQLRQLTSRPSYKDANWRLYRSIINSYLADADVNLDSVHSTNQIDDNVQLITTAIQEAQKQSVPMVSSSKYSLTLTPEITAMMSNRTTLERRYQRTRVTATRRILKIQINHFSTLIRHAIQELQNQNWAHFLESMPENDNYRKLWQTTKFLRNKCKKLPPLKTDYQILTTPSEKAEALASHFASVHQNPHENSDIAFEHQLEISVNDILNTTTPSNSIWYPALNEIEINVRSLKNTKTLVQTGSTIRY